MDVHCAPSWIVRRSNPLSRGTLSCPDVAEDPLMPVAILREDGAAGFAPVARPRFLLGRDLDCDLVDTSPGVPSGIADVSDAARVLITP